MTVVGTIAKMLLIVLTVAVLVTISLLIWIQIRARQNIVDLEEVTGDRVAVVYGARVYSSGALSPMLRDRVEMAVNLYKEGKADKILMSGDNRFHHYNEPENMKIHAINLGVPEEDVQPDYAGRRTYDTCYRALHIFKIKSAVLVSQKFHLPRALYTCDRLGIDVVGVVADASPYTTRSLAWSYLREIPATIVAVWDSMLKRPAPVLGPPIPLQ